MTIPTVPRASTLDTIASSIKNDSQVYPWFTMIVSTPDVQDKLKKSFGPATALYRKFWQITAGELTNYAFLSGLLVFSLFTRNLWTVVLPILMLLFLLWLYHQKRNLVIELSRALLLTDFPGESIEQKSLYQLGEIYARKYRRPSLVDTVSSWDSVMRASFIIVYTFLLFINPVSKWVILITLPLSFAIINLFLRFLALYRILK